MTLVVRWEINGFPFLIADTLISGPRNCGPAVAGPMFGPKHAINQVLDAEYDGPRGLLQKIVFCGDRLVLGWGGPVALAREVIQEIVARQSFEEFTFDSLHKFLEEYVLAQKQVGLIGFIEESACIKPFSWGQFSSEKLKDFGEVAVVGTGRDYFFNHAKRIENFEHGSINWKVENFEEALFRTLSRASMLLSEEQASGRTLVNAFGAAYEVISRRSNRLFKIDDILYLFWDAKVEADGTIGMRQMPHFGCRYGYQKDLLVIRTFKVHNSEPRIDTDVYTVCPIYRILTSEEKNVTPVPPFNAGLVCTHLTVRSDDVEDLTLVIVQLRPPDNSGLNILEEDGYIQMLGVEMVHQYAVSVLQQDYKRLKSRARPKAVCAPSHTPRPSA
jgi:hypothetical protein